MSEFFYNTKGEKFKKKVNLFSVEKDPLDNVGKPFNPDESNFLKDDARFRKERDKSYVFTKDDFDEVARSRFKPEYRREGNNIYLTKKFKVNKVNYPRNDIRRHLRYIKQNGYNLDINGDFQISYENELEKPKLRKNKYYENNIVGNYKNRVSKPYLGFKTFGKFQYKDIDDKFVNYLNRQDNLLHRLMIENNYDAYQLAYNKAFPLLLDYFNTSELETNVVAFFHTLNYIDKSKPFKRVYDNFANRLHYVRELYDKKDRDRNDRVNYDLNKKFLTLINNFASEAIVQSDYNYLLPNLYNGLLFSRSPGKLNVPVEMSRRIINWMGDFIGIDKEYNKGSFYKLNTLLGQVDNFDIRNF